MSRTTLGLAMIGISLSIFSGCVAWEVSDGSVSRTALAAFAVAVSVAGGLVISTGNEASGE